MYRADTSGNAAEASGELTDISHEMGAVVALLLCV